MTSAFEIEIKSAVPAARQKERKEHENSAGISKRLQRHLDELKWLYCELYPGREDMFTQLCEQMEAWYQDRPESEKKLDREREQEPAWYSRQDMLGMMLYIDALPAI